MSQSVEGIARLPDFKAFLRRQACDLSQPAPTRSHCLAAVNNFPEVTNLYIARSEVFSNAFRKQILGTYLPTAIKALGNEVIKRMDLECHGVWSMLKGCTAKCPLCGSKCSLVGEHDDHECTHHILPAFHGISKRTTQFPVLQICLSPESAKSEWIRGNGEPCPSLAAFLDSYDDYRPWQKSLTTPDPKLKQVPEGQIDAWVHCKKTLLAH